MNDSGLYWTTFRENDRELARSFDCGNPSINNFLRLSALYDQSDGLAVTRLLKYEDIIIGFYSARCTQLNVNAEDQNLNGLTTVPAMEVPYLAVHRKYQRTGFGKIVVEEILATAFTISSMIGCRYVFLRALNIPWLLDWYKSFEFIPTETGTVDRTSVPMRYKIPQPYEFDWETEFQ